MLACCWRGRTPSLPPRWVSTNVGTQAPSPWTALARYVCALGTPTLQTVSPTSSPKSSASLSRPYCVTYPGKTLLHLSISSHPKQKCSSMPALFCARPIPSPPKLAHAHPSSLEMGPGAVPLGACIHTFPSAMFPLSHIQQLSRDAKPPEVSLLALLSGHAALRQVT